MHDPEMQKWFKILIRAPVWGAIENLILPAKKKYILIRAPVWGAID